MGLRIPNLATLDVHYDRLRIVSTANPSGLRKLLLSAGIEQHTHDLHVRPIEHQSGHYRSAIEFTPVDWLAASSVLTQNEAALGQYIFTAVEVACDAVGQSEDDVNAMVSGMVARVRKRRPSRRYLMVIDSGGMPGCKKHGFLGGPTIYMEDRKSTVSIKFYARLKKDIGGKFTSDMLARMEIRFGRSSTIRRKFGGAQIQDLLSADLNQIVMDHVQLERFDRVRFGKLVGVSWDPKRVTPAWMKKAAGGRSIEEYHACRSANIPLRHFAARNERRLGGWERALEVTFSSPTEIRGILKELQAINPKITDYRINQCFTPVWWRIKL